ncbi:Methicillin resistance mecR1 protein [compost metagenome]
MSAFFQTVLQMSLTGSYVIMVVLLARLLLRKAPKLLSYLLWFAVLLRLLLPLNFESPYSVIPALMPGGGVLQSGGQLQTADSGRLAGSEPQVYPESKTAAPSENNPVNITDTGLAGGGRAGTVSGYPVKDEEASAAPPSPAEQRMSMAAYLWLAGTVLMLGWGMISALLLNRRLSKARHEDPGIYEWSGAQTPFVYGLLRPRIILPAGLGTHERGYIIRHEQIHIRRLDHLVKLAAYAALCLHWFNPLVWLAVYLMDEDMEKSCDEAVIRELGSGIKKEYSTSLLSLSTGRKFTGRTPLAFGESSTKGRIKNILKYKKPSLRVVTSAITLVIIAVAAAGLTGNLRSHKVSEEDYAKQYIAEQIARIEDGASGVKIVDSDLTVFEQAGRVEGLLSEPVELWRLEYRLEPDDLSKLPLAGGMNAVDGKITEDNSMGKPVLVFAYEGNTPRYEGVIWSAEYDLGTAAGRETALQVFFEGKGLLEPETYRGNHAIAKFVMSDGMTAHLLLSQPAVQGSSGIWVVERWKDGNGYEYYETPDTSSPSAVYFAGLQAEADQGLQPAELLDPLQAATAFVRGELGWNLTKEQIDLQIPAAAADFDISPVSELLGYVSGMTLAEPGFKFDNAEWLTDDEDPARLRRLGIVPERDMPGGFYVLNKLAIKDPLELADAAEYGIIEGAALKEASKAEFVQRLDIMAEAGMLSTVTMQDGKVIRIQERYLP